MENKYYFAVDVGGTKIKFGIFNGGKELIDIFSIDTIITKKKSEANLINYIFDAIDRYCKSNKYHIKNTCIKGIGFTIPGPVVKGKVLRAVNVNWEHNFDIVVATKKRYGANISVVVGNDGNLAALGEYVFNLKRKVDSMCMITLGTAIGTGIIINGKLIEGKHGVAGEISHLRVDYSKNAEKCKCGNVGCLETVTGGRALLNMYKKTYPNDKNTIIEARDIVFKAKYGDKKCLKVLTKSLYYLSAVLVSVILVYEPEVIIIGGGVSNGGRIITKIISGQIRKQMKIQKYVPKIILSKYKNKAGLYGAVAEL